MDDFNSFLWLYLVWCLHSFFQIKVDIPPECRIYPIDSEDEEDEGPDTARGVKEIICPWETVTKQDGAG